MWTLLLHHALLLSLCPIGSSQQTPGSSQPQIAQLLSSLSGTSGVPENQILNLISPGGGGEGGAATLSDVLSNPIVQNNLFTLLQILGGAIGQPSRDTDLNSMLTSSSGQFGWQNLISALQKIKQQRSTATLNPSSGGIIADPAQSAVESSGMPSKPLHNQGFPVPVSSNAGFVPLQRGGQSVSSSNIFGPVNSSQNRPIIVGSSGSGTNFPLEPIPTSIFENLNSNRRQPIYIFTRIDPVTGAIISPNMIFRVNYTAGTPVQPYLLTYLNTGVAQPTLKALLNVLNEYSNGPEQPTYLLSRIDETTGVPTPPFLLFNINRATGQPKAPYVLSRLDLPTGKPAQPEILQYLDRETGQLIVNEMLPLLNGYISQGSKRK